MADAVSAGVTPPLLSLPPRGVDVAAIERELRQLWREAGEGQSEAHPVTRACMSNLMVFCATPDEARAAGSEIPSIVACHPARVLLLVAGAEELSGPIEAYVSAQCHLAEGRRQVCSEHIAISARADALARLPSVVRPLLIGDLPTALWWLDAAAPPRGGAFFGEMAALADQVIYDSESWRDPAGDMIATAEWVSHARNIRVADLTWRRLKPWRRLIAQSLDPARIPGALDSIDAVAIDHGPHALPQAWQLLAWMARGLAWELASLAGQDVSTTWVFRTPAVELLHATVRRCAEGAPAVQRVRIDWHHGGEAHHACFELVGSGHLDVTVDGEAGVRRALPMVPPSRAALVARQLSVLRRDLAFIEVLQRCRALAALA